MFILSSDFWKFNDNDDDELSDNFIQEEARNGDLFSEHDEEMAEDKAKYNFAFFMILFVFGTTGAYYVFTTAKNKFFPQSNVSQYLKSKRWRYWDRSQVRFDLARVKYYWCFFLNLEILLLIYLLRNYSKG